MEGRMPADDNWGGPGFQQEPLPPQQHKEPARPIGQVAPAQRSTTPKSESEQAPRPPSVDTVRSQPSPRGGKGRGMPPNARGGFTRPVGHQQQRTPNPGPSSVGEHRPDLQKLGLKFGGQISITSTGQGKKMMGSGDGTGVSITKLKGDMPVGSPVNIRETGQRQQEVSSGQPKQGDPAQQIKTEPGQVKEEPKDFDGEDMGNNMERGEDEEGEFEEYHDEFEGDGVYQGDGDYEGVEGEEEVEEEEEGHGEMFTGEYDGYPEIGGDYEQEG